MNEHRNFDTEAAAWDANPVRANLADDVAAAMVAACPLQPTMDVLDFGCGTGLVSLRFAPLVRSLTGMDSSSGMLDVFGYKAAQLHLTNVRSQHCEADANAMPGGPYDLIVSSMTLHHVRDIVPLLRAFHAALRGGGRLCLADLDPDGGAFHSDNTGVFHPGFDRGELRATLLAAGFSTVTNTTAAEVVKPAADGKMRRFTVFLLSAERSPE